MLTKHCMLKLAKQIRQSKSSIHTTEDVMAYVHEWAMHAGLQGSTRAERHDARTQHCPIIIHRSTGCLKSIIRQYSAAISATNPAVKLSRLSATPPLRLHAKGIELRDCTLMPLSCHYIVSAHLAMPTLDTRKCALILWLYETRKLVQVEKMGN